MRRLPTQRQQLRHRVIHRDCGDGVQLSLAHYPPGTEDQPHRHDFTQISFLLAGAMLERVDGQLCEMHQPAVGIKPAGILHDDVWGHSGTLIFSLKINPATSALTVPRVDPGWVPLQRRDVVRRLVSSCFTADRSQLSLEASTDLLALLGDSDDVCSVQAPPWLERARCRIHDAPDLVAVDELAREAGVDRAHFSRMFRRCFGLPPSTYRQQVLAARAVTAVAHSGADLVEAALDAGYSDQSHMNRGIKAQTGMTPGQLRRLLHS